MIATSVKTDAKQTGLIQSGVHNSAVTHIAYALVFQQHKICEVFGRSFKANLVESTAFVLLVTVRPT